MNARAHLTIVPDQIQEHPTPVAKIKDINIIIDQLERVESDIQKLLAGLTGNPYSTVIRHIYNTESLIKEKTMDRWQEAIANLKGNLIIWKEFFGSGVCSLLETNLKLEAIRLEKEYPLNKEQITDIIDNIRLCTQDTTERMMNINQIGDLDTKGGIKLDTTKRVKNTPEALKGPLMGAKGTVPQLLMTIEMTNLMIAKITLLNVKVVLSSIRNLKISVEDILHK